MKRKQPLPIANGDRRRHHPAGEEGMMNDGTRGRRRRWRAERRQARTVAAIAVSAALAMLAAACSSGSPSAAGSGGTPDGAGSASSPSAVAYSACMRSHGVPDFPDPPSSGQVPKASAQELGVSSSRFQAAQQACQHLIPNTGDTAAQQQEAQCAQTGNCPKAVVQRWMSGLLRLARCLRTHGEPNWPDPIITSLAGHPPTPHFLYEQAGIDQHSEKVLNEVDECVHITGFQGLPLP